MAGKSDNAENGSAPATPKAGAGGGFSSLTAREQEILAKSMTCLNAPPEVSICTSIQIAAVITLHAHALVSAFISYSLADDDARLILAPSRRKRRSRAGNNIAYVVVLQNNLCPWVVR